jgi:hypothetical protein
LRAACGVIDTLSARLRVVTTGSGVRDRAPEADASVRCGLGKPGGFRSQQAGQLVAAAMQARNAATQAVPTCIGIGGRWAGCQVQAE